MKWNILILVSTIAFLWTGAVLWERSGLRMDASSPVMREQEMVGRPVPDFTFTTLEGQTSTFSSLRDKTVILNFWATWCVPCHAEFPLLLQVARAHPDTLVLLAVSIDDDETALRGFLKKHDLPANAAISWDRDKRIAAQLFQTIKVPETIIVAPGGIMRRKIAGAEWGAEEMEEMIAASVGFDNTPDP